MKKQTYISLSLFIIALLLFITSASQIMSSQEDIVWAKYGVDENTDNFEFSPDGNYLAVFKSEGNIFKVFSVNANLEPLLFTNAEIIRIYSVTWAADVKSVGITYLTGTDELKVNIWNLSDFKIQDSYPVGQYSPVYAELSPDMNITSFDGLNEFIQYNRSTKTAVREKAGFINDSTISFSSSKDGKLFAYISQNMIGIYSGKSLSAPLKKDSHPNAFNNCRLRFSPDTNYLSVYFRDENKAEIFKVNNENEIIKFREHKNTNPPVFISKTQYVVNEGSKLCLYDLSSSTPVKYTKEDFSRIFGAVSLGNGIGIAYADYSSSLMIDFDTNDTLKTFSDNNFYAKFTDKGRAVFTPHPDYIFSSSEGKLLAHHKDLTSSLSDTNLAFNFKQTDKINLYDIYTKQLVKEYTLSGEFYDAFLLNSNLAVLISMDLKRQLYDLSANKVLMQFDPYSIDLKLSKNEKYLAVPCADLDTGEPFMLIINMLTKDTLFNIKMIEINNFNFAFSPDEKRFYYSDKPGFVSILDLELKKKLQDIDLNGSSLPIYYFLAVSPDSRFLALYTQGTNIQIYDMLEKDIVYTYTDYFSYLTNFEFSPDGSFLLSAYEDGTCILYEARYNVSNVKENPIADYHKILIYPNPARSLNEMKIICSGLIPESLSIVDLSGTRIISETLFNCSLTGGNLIDYTFGAYSTPGVYYLLLKSEGTEYKLPFIISR